MTDPKISVLMSVYNGDSYLEEAMESILNQTYENFEFIIIDDGSTDNSLKIIESFRIKDNRVHLIKNEENIGLTRSLNKAIKQSKGIYIARQDADDVSMPNRFEIQMEYLEKNPEVALVGTSFYKIDGNSKIIGKHRRLTKPTFKDLIRFNRFSHGSVIFKKDVVDNLGGYNNFFRYVQDYELWLRIAKNYSVRNIPDYLYKSRVHDGRIGFNKMESSILFSFLARKLAKNEIDQETYQEIKKNDIRDFYDKLDEIERSNYKKTISRQLFYLTLVSNTSKLVDQYDYISNKRVIMFLNNYAVFKPILFVLFTYLNDWIGNIMRSVKNSRSRESDTFAAEI